MPHTGRDRGRMFSGPSRRARRNRTRTSRFRYTFLVLGYGIGAAAAVVAAGYQSMSPTGQWYGRTFTGLATGSTRTGLLRTGLSSTGLPGSGLTRGSKQIALTYDDGPNDPHTQRLLEVLARHGVRATFFVIGRFVQQRPEIVREIVQAGHAIGNHTFSHPNLIFQSAAQTRAQLRDCQQAIADATGLQAKMFRPPFGGRRPVTLRIAREFGLEPIMWNVTGYDWNAPPAGVIERKVTRRVRGGNVILLHDGGHQAMGADRSQTVIATDLLIGRYRDEGYEFVTVPEMMG